MVCKHMYLISLLFCWQAKIPDIEKCLDIVAALQAKKDLGEVCTVSEKPNYLFFAFPIMILQYCWRLYSRTQANKMLQFWCFAWSVGYFTLFEGTRLLLWVCVLRFCYPETVDLEPMTIFQIVLCIKYCYLQNIHAAVDHVLCGALM